VVQLALAAAIAAVALSGCQRAPSDRAAAPEPAPGPSRSAPVASRPEGATQVPVPASSAQSVPRDAITDSVITARIKAGILSDPGMSGSDVSVNTDRGVVSLTGAIKSPEQAAIASA